MTRIGPSLFHVFKPLSRGIDDEESQIFRVCPRVLSTMIALQRSHLLESDMIKPQIYRLSVFERW